MADENSNGTDLPEQNDERAEHSMEPISPQANEQLVLDDNRVAHTDIQKEMRQSYLDYAISVIVERALPDVRDGMKPVHRRIVYAMYDGGYRPDRGYSKCARRRRRRDGQLPPTRRRRDLRFAGAHGPAVVDAIHAGRRAGQLRLGR